MSDILHPPPAPARQFAIVELFGHGRIAGQISEQSFGGAELVRVDVPEVSYTEAEYVNGERRPARHTIPAHTRSFGAKAVYSINWCDEAAAIAAAHAIRDRTLSVYSLRSALEQLSHTERAELIGCAPDGQRLPGDARLSGPQQREEDHE
jgi:hypothetical protein